MITHCRLLSDMPRSRWADGRAMFTIVASSTTMSWAMAMTTSPHQRRGSGGVPDQGGGGTGGGFVELMKDLLSTGAVVVVQKLSNPP